MIVHSFCLIFTTCLRRLGVLGMRWEAMPAALRQQLETYLWGNLKSCAGINLVDVVLGEFVWIGDVCSVRMYFAVYSMLR